MARLCDAGTTLFRQVNEMYPNRDTASDGWLNWSPTSDHCPDPQTGISHAVDIDASFGAGGDGWDTSKDAWKLANQLRAAMLAGDRRISYIIAWNPEAGKDFICSMNRDYSPLGVWREYTGDSHQNHIHVSFTEAADNDGRPFDLDSNLTEETKDLQLNDDLYAGDDKKDVTVGEVLRRMDRFMTNTAQKLNRLEGLTDKMAAVKAAVEALPEGASKAEVRELLENLDAEINLVVRDEPTPAPEEAV